MKDNQELARAIEQAVFDVNQPKAVAKRIIAWVEEMRTRDSLSRDENGRHLTNVFEAIPVDLEGSDED